MEDSIELIIACVVAVCILVITIIVCLLCRCCKHNTDTGDHISMKHLNSNYSEPSDAITSKEEHTPTYNYTNPYDKRGSDAAVVTVKPTPKHTKVKQKKEKRLKISNSKNGLKDTTCNYNYVNPYDTRDENDGIMAVKYTKKSSYRGKDNFKNTVSDQTSSSKSGIQLGSYIDVNVSCNGTPNINPSSNNIKDISSEYSDVANTVFNNRTIPTRTKGPGRGNLPAPYSVVKLH